MNNSIEIITEKSKVYIPNVLEYSSVAIKSDLNDDLILVIENFEKRISLEFEFETENYEDCNNYYEKIKEILSRKVEVKEND